MPTRTHGLKDSSSLAVHAPSPIKVARNRNFFWRVISLFSTLRDNPMVLRRYSNRTTHAMTSAYPPVAMNTQLPVCGCPLTSTCHAPPILRGTALVNDTTFHSASPRMCRISCAPVVKPRTQPTCPTRDEPARVINALVAFLNGQRSPLPIFGCFFCFLLFCHEKETCLLFVGSIADLEDLHSPTEPPRHFGSDTWQRFTLPALPCAPIVCEAVHTV
jgi:hypothetical protein